MPGVDKSSVDIRVEDDVLKIEGRLDFSKYQGLQPIVLCSVPQAMMEPLGHPKDDRPLLSSFR